MTQLNTHPGWADTLPSQFGPMVDEPTRAGEEIEVPLGEDDAPAPALQSAQRSWGPWPWVREGLRAGIFLRPRSAPAEPGPWMVLGLMLTSSLVQLAGSRLQVAGAAVFDLSAWLAPWWSSLVLLWLAWWGIGGTRSSAQVGAGVASWMALSAWAMLLPVVPTYLLMAWVARHPERWAQGYAPQVFWGAYGLLVLWALAVLIVLGMRFIAPRSRQWAYGVGVLAIIGVGTWHSPEQPWRPDPAALAAAEAAEEPPRLQLNQAAFETQQALWAQQVRALAPQRPGVVDVYGLVFAPYAGENVFRKESTMVADLLRERFDAQGRVLHLLNHGETVSSHPWATPQNLERAVQALARKMDREHDVLVVYLTSHGARNHELAASHWPLQVDPVAPETLRTLLDAAGIRNRVIAISACFSGGWVEPLESDTTLVMTAADATHTSYGCGSKSDLTFFGRAVFDEQLRKTHSFAQAFEQAVPVIQQREVEAGKADGFSNPQLRVGSQLAPVLKALEERLDAAPEVVSQFPSSTMLAQLR